MDLSEDQEKFRELLNIEYSWPAKYTFKFIVPTDKEQHVLDLFDNDVESTVKPSSGGKYSSITAYPIAPNAEMIIKIYQKASEIEGIISL